MCSSLHDALEGDQESVVATLEGTLYCASDVKSDDNNASVLLSDHCRWSTSLIYPDDGVRFKKDTIY